VSTKVADGTTTRAQAAPELALPQAGPLDEERTRLAYAIHDGLTQVVTASVLELEWLARRTDADPTAAPQALERAATHLRDALEEIRGVLTGLDPGTALEEPGFEALIEELIGRWQIRATWSVEGDLGRIPRPVLDVAAAVIREGVTNAAKHASPAEVGVRVHASSGGLRITVEDDGVGLEGRTGPRPGHLGLEMLRRRVAELGGELDLASEPGRGASLRATLPMPERTVSP
jgi:signal transduction histidine kinase